MEQLLVFDVDGTLTGPRRVMHEDFARFFRSLCVSRPVFLVSGSDMGKLRQQVPEAVLDAVAGVFACSGNEFIVDKRAVYRMEHFFPGELTDFVDGFIAASPYPVRCGRHRELRTGSLNVSVVGRDADPAQRAQYYAYDQEHGERQALIDAVMARFTDYEANRGGQISVDISPMGWNKARVCQELTRRFAGASLVFFGDNIEKGGNDQPLAEAVTAAGADNRVHPVADHYETWRILQDEYCPLVPKMSAAG